MNLSTKKETEDHLKNVFNLFPKLVSSMHKGDCGRIGVIGGSPDYTGAPYFSSITALRIGGDMSYVYSHPDAAPIIKSYDPEIMVIPSLKFNEIESYLSHLHSIVLGPGIGRNINYLLPLINSILNFMRKFPHISLVVDADGIFLLGECLDNLKDLKNQVIITPNCREFNRLYTKAFQVQETCIENNDNVEKTMKLAKFLNVCILRKGENDIITDGNKVYYSTMTGSLRRCGGQGDILSGTVALFSHWERYKKAQLLQTEINKISFDSNILLKAATAASDFVRFVANQTFKKIGRSMTASEIIKMIPIVIKENFDSNN